MTEVGSGQANRSTSSGQFLGNPGQALSLSDPLSPPLVFLWPLRVRLGSPRVTEEPQASAILPRHLSLTPQNGAALSNTQD